MATNDTKCSGVTNLDPVQGLVDYVNTIKPYHTKVIEVLVEYVYGENVEVHITEDPNIQVDITRPKNPNDLIACGDGFSLRPFGTGMWPIASPNQNIAFENYPAITAPARQFILPGDRSADLNPGTKIDLISFIEDYTNVYDIVSVIAGPAGSGSFDVIDTLNTFSTVFSVNDTIEAISTEHDDMRPLTIINMVHNSGITTVYILQDVLSTVVGGRLGLVRTPGNNTGSFTVAQAIYSGGSIDSWAGYPDPLTYTLGDDPHTTVTVVEALNTPIFTPGTEVYSIFMRLSSFGVENVLSYSNFVPTFNPVNPDLFQTPDEGFLYTDIIGTALSTIDGFGFPIPDTGKFIISGNIDASNIFVGDKARITGSTGNNGTFTIASFVYDAFSDTTTIGVDEEIDSLVPDGKLQIEIPANVFIVDGDYRRRFTQGVIFDIAGGSYDGQYTTLYSRFINGKTRIRPTREIIDVGAGARILDTTGGFQLNGDRTSQFGIGVMFNVVGSQTNDGSYTVASSTYVTVGSPPQSYTVIIPVESFDNTQGGEIFVSQPGILKEHIYGFGETSDFCHMTPEGYAHVKIHEQLTFDGLGLDLTDDIIAYNLENSDTWGYDIPLFSIISGTEPVIPEQTTPPILPTQNDLWFDTISQILKRWNNYDWKEVKTAYWLDTNGMLLHYRTKDKFIDTNWVLLFAQPPGFSQIQPAVDNTKLLGTEDFTVGFEDILANTIQSTFIFKNITAPVFGVDLETLTLEGAFYAEGNFLGQMNGMNINTGERTLDIVGSVGNDSTYTITSVIYDPIFDQTRITVAEDIATSSITGDIIIGPLAVPNTDKSFIKVFINNIPADFSLDNASQFTLINQPHWELGDDIKVEVFKREGIETNAQALGFSLEAHQVYHRDISIYPGQEAYVVFGGNYIERFIPENRFEVMNVTTGGGVLEEHQTQTFPIIDVDDQLASITILGDYSWLFEANRIFSVRTSGTNTHDFQVSSSSFDGTNTIIIVNFPDVYESPSSSPLDPLQYFYNPGVDVFNIDSVTNTIIIQSTEVDIDITSSYPVGMKIQLSNSTINNNGIWTVQSSSYDIGNNRTNITVVEDIPDPDSSGLALIHTPIIQNYSRDLGHIIGAVFDPIVTNDQPKTYVVPTTLVQPTADSLAYVWFGPLRVDLAISRDNDLMTAISERTGISDEMMLFPDHSDNYPEGKTATIFDEDLNFGWGTDFSWNIIGVDTGTSTIFIDSDITNILDPDDNIQIFGSHLGGSPIDYRFDGEYDVASLLYNVGLNRTEIILKTPTLPIIPLGSPPTYGTLRMDNLDVTNWYQYLILEALPTMGSPPSPINSFIIHGDATLDLQSGQEFRVLGTTNDGIFTIPALSPPVYFSSENYTEVLVTETITNNEQGGFIESHRDQGIRIILEDQIGVVAVENVAGALILSAGNFVDAWDYNYWNVGAFDENTDVLTLYSN